MEPQHTVRGGDTPFVVLYLNNLFIISEAAAYIEFYLFIYFVYLLTLSFVYLFTVAAAYYRPSSDTDTEQR